jgi:hypothetical protein
MKAITLTQPWASLVAIGAKRIETRSWKTAYRGPLAIHAAKAFPGWAKDLCESRMVCTALGWPVCDGPLTQAWLDDNAASIRSLPLGRVVATARLVQCIEVDLIERFVQPFTDQERALGNYEAGRYGFLLDAVRPLAYPIPARGALSLWEWEVPSL